MPPLTSSQTEPEASGKGTADGYLLVIDLTWAKIPHTFRCSAEDGEPSPALQPLSRWEPRGQERMLTPLLAKLSQAVTAAGRKREGKRTPEMQPASLNSSP